jgi:hypothetical protein
MASSESPPSSSSYWSLGLSHLTDHMKRRAGKYLINRYLGNFIEDRIILDQLSVDDAISVKDVALDIEHINELMLNQGWRKKSKKLIERKKFCKNLELFVNGHVV